MAKTHPEQLAERFRRTAVANMDPALMALQELLDMQRAYVLALEILIKEKKDESK